MKLPQIVQLFLKEEGFHAEDAYNWKIIPGIIIYFNHDTVGKATLTLDFHEAPPSRSGGPQLDSNCQGF